MGLQTEGIIFMITAYLCITVVLTFSYYKLLTKPKKD
jgi:hypothetical protein